MPNEMEAKATTAVAKTQRRGAEERAEQDDIEIPRAKLIQPTSEELKDVNSPLKGGQVINSITHDVLGPTFIPVMRLPSNFIRYNARKNDDPNFDKEFDLGAMVYRTNDANDPRVKRDNKFGPKGEPPVVTKFLNFLCLFEGVDMPLVLSFAKTSFKAGKHFNLLIENFGGDVFSRKYKLSVKAESKPGTGNWFVFKVDPAGPATEAEFKQAEEWYERFASRRETISVDHEAEPDAEAETVKDPSGKPLF